MREPAKLGGQVDQEQIRETVEEWLRDAIARGPAEKDVDRMIKFLEKRAARKKGCDVCEVCDVLEWWASFLETECGPEADASGRAGALWSSLRRVKTRLASHVQKEYGIGF